MNQPRDFYFSAVAIAREYPKNIRSKSILKTMLEYAAICTGETGNITQTKNDVIFFSRSEQDDQEFLIVPKGATQAFENYDKFSEHFRNFYKEKLALFLSPLARWGEDTSYEQICAFNMLETLTQFRQTDMDAAYLSKILQDFPRHNVVGYAHENRLKIMVSGKSTYYFGKTAENFTEVLRWNACRVYKVQLPTLTVDELDRRFDKLIGLFW